MEITRQEAKAQGLKHYFTGKPHGLVSSMACCQCAVERRHEVRARQAAYKQQNRADILVKKTEYYQANRAEILAQKAANPHIYNARAQKLQATPPWADLEAIKGIYEQAAFLTRVTGESNHIIPFARQNGLRVARTRQLANINGHRQFKKELKVYSIVDWNDTPGRTKEEVIAALRGKPL